MGPWTGCREKIITADNSCPKRKKIGKKALMEPRSEGGSTSDMYVCEAVTVTPSVRPAMNFPRVKRPPRLSTGISMVADNRMTIVTRAEPKDPSARVGRRPRRSCRNPPAMDPIIMPAGLAAFQALNHFAAMTHFVLPFRVIWKP